MNKKCRVCGEDKPIVDFHKNAKCKHGVDDRCATCKNKKKREHDATDSAKLKGKIYRAGDAYKDSRARQADTRSERRAEKASANRLAAGDLFISRIEAKEKGLTRYNEGLTCKRGHMADRSLANNQCMECVAEKRKCPDYLSMKKKYWDENKDRLIQRGIEAQKARYAVDPGYKAATAARNMLKRVLVAGMNNKDGRSSDLLGFTGLQLRDHIASLFTEGMSWGNYGEWHIDHIKPVSLFISSGITDPSIVNALSNLQPLWAEDNFKKRDKFCIP